MEDAPRRGLVRQSGRRHALPDGNAARRTSCAKSCWLAERKGTAAFGKGHGRDSFGAGRGPGSCPARTGALPGTCRKASPTTPDSAPAAPLAGRGRSSLRRKGLRTWTQHPSQPATRRAGFPGTASAGLHGPPGSIPCGRGPPVPCVGTACGSRPAFCGLQALQPARRHLEAGRREPPSGKPEPGGQTPAQLRRDRLRAPASTADASSAAGLPRGRLAP